MARQFIARYPRCADKLRVVYNGVPLQRFTPVTQPAALELGMLCTVEPRKRLYEAIIMFDGLRRQHRDGARLHIGGGWSGDWTSQEYYQVLCRMVKRLGLDDQVVFHGHVPDTPGWLRQIDVFISNSYREGQQVALLEAMAAGCCCFAHVWDGADEVLPPEHLYTTDVELQRKVVEYAQQPEDERRARRARMRAIAEERFDIETTKARIRAVIDEAMGREGHGAEGRSRRVMQPLAR
jgi:glycosyltransferase involved in cell wall biosynthesis